MAEKRSTDSRLSIELGDAPDAGGLPPLAAYLVDRSGKVIRQADIDPKGNASLPGSDIAKAAQVLIGPAANDLSDVDPDALVRLHASDVAETIKAGSVVQLGPSDLAKFFLHRVCVDGSVTACRYRPWLFEERVLAAAPIRAKAAGDLQELGLTSARHLAAQMATIDAIDIRPVFPWPVCSDVCHGLVDVYVRTCCCPPIYVRDPRITDLLKKLKQIIKVRPPIKWPPPPPPPPIFETNAPVALADELPPAEVLNGGVLNEALINAEADVHALQLLEAEAVPAFIADRPYLRPFWCSCGAGVKKGTGTLRPDGTFQICWFEPPVVMLPWCHREYAFVVRQVIHGQLTVIYDGLAANKWFNTPSGVHLTTYDWRAIGCDGPVTPDDGTAFVNLERMGSAYAYRLLTPDQDSWSGVQIAHYNDGLLDPAPNALAARGTNLDSNWGGVVALTYKFSDAMQSRGAEYYRVNVTAADANGHPTGSVSPLQGGVAWYFYDYSTPSGSIQSQSLGPVTVNGEGGLYTIPYRADRDWVWSAHAFFDTTRFPPGRYLVMLEVFDQNAVKLRPTGSSGPGTDANFQYRHWFQETGPLQVVPYAALTHLFWCDNRPAVADIVDLRVGSASSMDDCQFLAGTPATSFSVGYRAYHPNPMFIYGHSMRWYRGLSGVNGLLESSDQNEGQFVLAVTSEPVTFEDMLGPGSNHRCAFTANLNVTVKTTNGGGHLYNLDAHDQAAFALED